MNAYPYASGHVLVLPLRHVGSLAELTAEESAEVWAATQARGGRDRGGLRADGLNMGANLGRAAGAGIPAHVHLHVAAPLVRRHQLHDLGGRDPGHARDPAAVLEEAHRRLAPLALRPAIPALPGLPGRPRPRSPRVPTGSRRRPPSRRCRCSRRAVRARPRRRRPPPVPPPGAQGVAGHPHRLGFVLVGVRALGAVVQDLRAQGFRTAFADFDWWWVGPAVIVEIASYFCFAAMQFELLKAGQAPGAVDPAGEADVRLAGDHQLAAHRQRRVLGLRLPLVPPFRRRQHAGGLGAGGHPRRRHREPVPRRRRSGSVWRPRKARHSTSCPC